VGQVVTRKVDSGGCISFAGATYRAGRAHRGHQVQVAIVDNSVEITADGEVRESTASDMTAAVSTARSPTSAADRHASTPPEPAPRL
jgi:hypothetical protein